MATGEALGGVIIGTVVTRDGWPVEHAVVTVVDATGTQSGRTAVGHDGHLAVAGLNSGSYTVITAAVGRDPQARTGMVNGAGPVVLGRVVLPRAGVTALPRPGIWQIDPAHSTVAATAVHLATKDRWVLARCLPGLLQFSAQLPQTLTVAAFQAVQQPATGR
jgi:hypothetical protein